MTPETRLSLLMQIRDPQNHEAWQEFVQLYEPVILRMAMRKGLQAADADDIAQQVFVSIAKVIETNPYDPERARFRTWLYRIADNAILNALTRSRPDRASGDNQILEQLNATEAPDDVQSALIQERRQEVLRLAAEQIRHEFEESTWQAFWMTSIDGVDCQTAADSLNCGIGSVYAARSRIVRRLSEKVREFEF